ncbi:MAG: hypothetical protein HC880_07925, partial [Bacteroidia bacterium]|nr:hypothetical protein [Bacteroidia bacterium]
LAQYVPETGFNWRIVLGNLDTIPNPVPGHIQSAITYPYGYFGEMEVVTVLDARMIQRATHAAILVTLMHESVHAYINSVLKSNHPKRRPFEQAIEEFFIANPASFNMGEAHHQELFKIYLGRMSYSLYWTLRGELDYSLMMSYNPNFHKDMVMSGLTHLPIFETLYPNAEDRARVIATIEGEKFGFYNDPNTGALSLPKTKKACE